MVLIHHRFGVVGAVVEPLQQRSVVEAADPCDEFEVPLLCGGFHLLVPTANGVAPHLLLERVVGHLRATADLADDPVVIGRPVGTWHVERLRLVIRETVHHAHRQTIEQHPITGECLLEPAVESRRVHLLHQQRLRHRIVCTVLLPGARPRRIPGEFRGHRTSRLPAVPFRVVGEQ